MTQDTPVTGRSAAVLNDIDASVMGILQNNNVPGCQFAFSKNGKILYSKGFGYACKEKKTPVEPKHLFRIASVSKPMTAVAIMKLVEDSELALDDRAFSILREFAPAKDKADSRLFDITIRNLLEHSGGFTTDNGDPQIDYLRKAADAMGRPRPADAETIIRYVATQPLNFDPGTGGRYSNLGYNILGRIIEAVSGTSYEQFMRDEVFNTAGMKSIELGRTKLKDQHVDEVYYFDGMPEAYSIFEDEPDPVPWSYGGKYYVEAFDAHGGWISTANDLLKFACAVDGREFNPQILKKETTAEMIERPDFFPSDCNEWYAKGWSVHEEFDRWTHYGGLEYGTASGIFRLPHGVNAAFVANHMPRDHAIYANMLDLACSISQRNDWPEEDEAIAFAVNA